MSDATFQTIDETGHSYTAAIGGHEITFTRALSARLELALEERKRRTVDESVELLTACLRHMAPGHSDAIESLFDELGFDELTALVKEAALGTRATPFTERQQSSPQAVIAGRTGGAAPISAVSTS